jgi:Tol biopolymer transport system component
MTFSRASAFVVMMALGVLPTMAGGAQQADPGVQLRAAIEKEEVAGDLEGAMTLYRQIIAANSKNRPVTAKAMLRLAGCYEKLGQAEARKLYEQLLAEYSDQTQEVTSARARLAALAKTAEPQKPTFRQIRIPTKLPADGSGKLSPDGQTLAYIEGRSLWTVPVHGKSDPNIAGAPTRLTEPMHAWDTANICVEWSVDGKWIGFIVEDPQSGKNGTPVEELYVVPAAGGTPRRVQARMEGWAGQAYTLRYALSTGAEVLYFAAGKELNDLRIYSVPTRGGDPRPVTAPITREPALSPDGSRIAFVKGENFKERLLNSKEIWVASIDGTAARLVYRLRDESPGAEVRGPIWSPDGKMLAFLTRMPQRTYSRVLVLPVPDAGGPAPEPAAFDLQVGPNGTENLLAGWTRDNRIGILFPTEERTAIYTIPAAGGSAVQLTPKAGIEPAWTPDGKRIYFLGFHGGDKIGLEVVPAEGGAVERVPLGGGYSEHRWGINGDLSVSPDGQLICFPGAETRERVISLGIFTLPIRGKLPTRLTTHGNGATGGDGFSVWSPDGTSIAFIRADLDITSGNTTSNILVIPRDGGEPRQLTTDADRVRLDSLAWSPDGRAIAFSASDKTLRIVPAAGGASRILAQVNGSGLTWSPDGETLAYVSGGALWRIPAAGGAPTKVETGLDARPDGPAWSPDGKSIAFSATSGGDEHQLWLMEDFVRLVKAAKR